MSSGADGDHPGGAALRGATSATGSLMTTCPRCEMFSIATTPWYRGPIA